MGMDPTEMVTANTAASTPPAHITANAIQDSGKLGVFSAKVNYYLQIKSMR